ncbi:MAG: hypothetical protein E7262_09615 [Lachnospiraceae bacterium]|nr:hypothetical protein [Lachnospiraceae bacterium]
MRKRRTSIVSMIMVVVILLMLVAAFLLTGCSEAAGSTYSDKENTKNVADKLANNQPTPTDIDYSLERYNLIKRTYWVNGQREKANTLQCEIEKPLGYIVLISESGAILNQFVVDGKVSSLNSYLTPDSEYYEQTSQTYSVENEWLADVDGSYGENDQGIFFFTTDGKYIEWTGTYLYSDIPFEVDKPILKIGK